MAHNTDDLEKAVIEGYRKVYPEWKDVKVTQTVNNTFGGKIAVINAIDEDEEDVEEMCFVFDDGRVQIFQSTEQLSIFLDTRINVPWYQRVFSTSLLSGIIFFMSILLIFIAGFFDTSFNDRAFSILGSVVGAAAGYYFGSSKK